MVAPDRDRLRRIFRQQRASAAAKAAEEAAAEARPELRDYLRSRSGSFLPLRQPVALPPGEEVASPHGPFWRRLLRYPLAQAHGLLPLATVREADPAHLARECRLAADAFALERCLFVDTETTGLHGGAGTVVFAFGFAWVEADAVVLEQLFLRDFGEEPAILQHVATRLRERPLPVTYVGKSFDRHRIAARLAVHKIEAPVLTPAHIDLYHLARRRHGKEFADCRLRTLEALVLGFHRHDDLPGSEAPRAFLDWIRDRTGAVDRVLEHNRLDVLSVVALLGVLGRPR